jgi:hypothetical protein
MTSKTRKTDTKMALDLLAEALDAAKGVKKFAVSQIMRSLEREFSKLELPVKCRDGSCGTPGVHVHLGDVGDGSVSLEAADNSVSMTVRAGRKTYYGGVSLENLDFFASSGCDAEAVVFVAQSFRDLVMRMAGVDTGSRS